NPLIADYRCPTGASVTGGSGSPTASDAGVRLIASASCNGQMRIEASNAQNGTNGPAVRTLAHRAEETISEIEHILHTNERPSRGRFHEGRGTDYRKAMIEMHISEIGFCSGHSASGIWTNERGECSIPGLYAAGDCASIPHNYMLGAFVYGKFCGE